jgi:CRISPR system Cascade subunit CasA
MSDMVEKKVSFNLWRDPWIQLEKPGGEITRTGIEQALIEADGFRGLYETSPLVVAGIHRMLTAVLQHAFCPQSNGDLTRIRKAGKFQVETILEFGANYAHRFELFSQVAPFLQSADLPLNAGKDAKTIAYLAPEIPAGTAVTHFRHGSDTKQAFCPACASGCLVAMPAFATSGGSGIKPSINGVPPVYVLPSGGSLFESLALSLICPAYFPPTATKSNDLSWWVREPIVRRSEEVYEVGYLHSLTFPARRIRLHPLEQKTICTRCGMESDVVVRTMVFEMGESRPKEADIWIDPFAAYKIHKKAKDKPTPVRPSGGKALWREYASLFLHELPAGSKEGTYTIRPRILEQIEELDPDLPLFRFRCIGMSTDMKAKVFEWMDAGFDLPPALLSDENAGFTVSEAIELASECAKEVSGAFRKAFSSGSSGTERSRQLRMRMLDEYWAGLANPFRTFILDLGAGKPEEAALKDWALMCIDYTLKVYIKTASLFGDDAKALRSSITGERYCRYRLNKLKDKWIPENQEVPHG